MDDHLQEKEKWGLAAWLFLNTRLTVEQVSRYTRLSGLHVALLRDGSLTATPVDPVASSLLSREDIEEAEQDPASWLPRPWSWSMLEMKSVRERSVEDAAIESAFLSRVSYTFYGRNAWHSTWIQRYSPGSIDLTTGALQSLCERRRVQGSVFNIVELPCLVLRTARETFFLVEINSGDWLFRLSEVFSGPLFVKRILREYDRAPDNTVLWLAVSDKIIPRPANFSSRFKRIRSRPQGTGRAFAWVEASEPRIENQQRWSELLWRIGESLPLTRLIVECAKHLPGDIGLSQLDVEATENAGVILRHRGMRLTFDSAGQPVW